MRESRETSWIMNVSKPKFDLIYDEKDEKESKDTYGLGPRSFLLPDASCRRKATPKTQNIDGIRIIWSSDHDTSRPSTPRVPPQESVRFDQTLWRRPICTNDLHKGRVWRWRL
jgi:hypothetical protein